MQGHSTKARPVARGIGFRRLRTDDRPQRERLRARPRGARLRPGEASRLRESSPAEARTRTGSYPTNPWGRYRGPRGVPHAPPPPLPIEVTDPPRVPPVAYR